MDSVTPLVGSSSDRATSKTSGAGYYSIDATHTVYGFNPSDDAGDRGNAVIDFHLRRGNNTMYRSSFRICSVTNDRRVSIIIVLRSETRTRGTSVGLRLRDDERFFVTVVSRREVVESSGERT